MKNLQSSERWRKPCKLLRFHIQKKYCEDKIKTFPDKQKSTKYVASRPILQEMPKDTVRLKGKDIRVKPGFTEKNIRKGK